MTTVNSENPQGQLNLWGVQSNGNVGFANLAAGGLFVSPGIASIGAHLVGGTGAIAATSGAASASVCGFSGTDVSGRVFWQTSGSPAVGAQVFVLFSIPFVNVPFVTVTPVSSSTSGQNPYVSASLNGFTYNAGVIPAATGSYGFNYLVVG